MSVVAGVKAKVEAERPWRLLVPGMGQVNGFARGVDHISGVDLCAVGLSFIVPRH
jgi:hypothetical protein